MLISILEHCEDCKAMLKLRKKFPERNFFFVLGIFISITTISTTLNKYTYQLYIPITFWHGNLFRLNKTKESSVGRGIGSDHIPSSRQQKWIWVSVEKSPSGRNSTFNVCGCDVPSNLTYPSSNPIVQIRNFVPIKKLIKQLIIRYVILKSSSID